MAGGNGGESFENESSAQAKMAAAGIAKYQ
jgi:hypothetical protein